MKSYLSLLSLALSGSLAKTENTAAGYLSFVDKHPGDPHKGEATAYALQLEDDADWKVAESSNSLASYQKYIQSDPRGTHAQDAHDRVEGLERSDAWKIAQADGSEAALTAFLQKFPLGAEADQARKRLSVFNSGYRASLGAFASEVAARHKRAEMQARFRRELREVDVLVPGASNSHYRVTSGLMDRRDAESLCFSLKRDHQACEVIKTDEVKS